MPSAASRQPTPLAELRSKAQETLTNLRPDEYSLRTWINTARVAFESAERAWKDVRATGDGRKAEAAFLEYKKAAGVMQLILKHHGYADLKRNKPSEYYSWIDLTRVAKEAGRTIDEVLQWLEKREAEWTAQHGRPPPPTKDGIVQNGGAPARPARPPSPHARTAPPVRPPSPRARQVAPPAGNSSVPARPETVKTPSYPTTSLADRMAALRASGLSSADPTAGPSRTLDQPTSSSSCAISSPKRSSTPSLPSSSPRSTASATLRSPPASPRVRKGDLVADNGGARTGSAPPVLPYSEVQDPATVWEQDALQFRREGGTPIAKRENGVVDRGPAGGVGAAPEERGPHSELSASASPTRTSFPSLEDFEQQVNRISTASSSSPSGSSFPSLPSLPSVPSSDPSTQPRPPRPPPPKPPQPKNVDAATFERQQRERQDALQKQAALYSNSTSRESSTATAAPARSGHPAARAPGRSAPAPPTASSSSSPLPPPNASTRSFNIPFSTEVRPLELWQYLQTAKGEKGEGPRVLLLDVRSRGEYERARIKGETVCMEPVSLRNNIKSTEIEDSLSLGPPHEAAIFSARNFYDIVVMYDRSSTTLPTSPPTSTSSEAQRVLWNLGSAIYEREFYKSLKRQPLLLRGGWEAWEKQVGVQGIVGTAVEGIQAVSVAQSGEGRSRASREDVEKADAKKVNRRAAVLPGVSDGQGAVLRNGTIPYLAPKQQGQPSSDYFFPSSDYGTSPPPANGIGSGMISPRLAMPPVAASRSGPAPSYDPFALIPNGSYPAPPQPRLDGYSIPTSPVGSPAMPRTRSDVNDLYAVTQGTTSYANGDYTRSSFEYPRPSIDYPQLHHRAAPPVPSNRPAASMPYTHPQVALPPPVKPAPARSNSSFSSLQLAQYSPSHSRFPTNMSFDEGVIGLSGLKNLGNTCYMNSTIQCLSAAIPFARYFTGGAYRKDINVVNPLGTKGQLANAVAELIRALWAMNYHFLSPVTFREQICRVAPQFRGSDQHDAQEFLGFLLDGLHEDCNYVVKKPPPVEMTPEREHDLETLPPQLMSEREWQIYKMRNDSFIVQCFQGQFRNQLRCLTCQKTSTTYNTFMPLSVPVPGGRGVSKVTLMACLEQFVRDEVLDGDDAWFCPRCKKNRQAIKKLSLSKLPPILVIHLKRFSFQGPFSDKIETQVQYPLSGLDLSAFIPPPLMEKRTGQVFNSAPPKGYVYDLFGVTNHYGNLSSGHYTAFVRSGREWNNIGDSKVTQCDPRMVESAKSAYILYYAMRT
ncbi:hypothetical protein JCM11251_007125 [Rhodosporidiobolus azoricus]